jgi:hypothetical protein
MEINILPKNTKMGFGNIAFRVLFALGCLALARALWLSIWHR